MQACEPRGGAKATRIKTVPLWPKKLPTQSPDSPFLIIAFPANAEKEHKKISVKAKTLEAGAAKGLDHQDMH